MSMYLYIYIHIFSPWKANASGFLVKTFKHMSTIFVFIRKAGLMTLCVCVCDIRPDVKLLYLQGHAAFPWDCVQ